MAPNPPEEVPAWPSGDPGRTLLHLDIKGGSVDAVFADLFGNNSDFQRKLHEVRGDTNCVESPWFSSRNELPQQQYEWDGPAAGTDLGKPVAGMCRKVRFEAPPPPLASRGFQSEEIQRVLEASPGSHYLVETDVFTNAMYGDRFTIMCRYTLVARGPMDCELHLVYVINFVPGMSRMMKPVVSKGVDGGIRGTFTQVRRLLAAQYTVEDFKEGHPAPTIGAAAGAPARAAEAVAQAPPAPPPGLVPAQPAALFGLADYMVYQELVAKVVALPDTVLVAKGLAIALTLLVLHAAIALLVPLQAACGSARGWLGMLFWPVVNVLDFPDSLAELLSGLLLVAAANRLLAFGVDMASDYIRESARAQQRMAMQQAAAAGVGTEAPAMVVNGEAVLPAGVPSAGPAMARLEIAAADESRKASPPKGSMSAFLSKSFTASKKPAVANNAAASLQGATAAAGPSGAAADVAPSKSADTGSGASGGAASAQVSMPGSRAPSPAPAAASPTPSPIVSSSPVLGAAAASGDEGDKGQAGSVVGKVFGSNMANAMNSWSKSLLAANSEVVDSVSSSSETFKSFMTGAWQRTQESAKSLILTEAGGSAPLDSSYTASPRARRLSGGGGSGGFSGTGKHSHTPSFTTTIDAGGFSIIEDYAQPDKEALPNLSEEASAGGEEGLGAAAGAASAPSPRVQRAATPVVDANASASSNVLPALSVTASESEAPSETGLDEVEEEVFEHERVQPFRGWGHQWPGHFLPSDRVGHWGDRKGLPGGATAANYEQVVPRLREGWEWRDAEWRIDYTGLDQEAVDKDGWQYGMDFGWLTWPPTPGGGKANIKSFVRRRRWVRTRVRSPDGGGAMPLRPLSRASQEQPSFSAEEPEGVGQQANVAQAAPAKAAAAVEQQGQAEQKQQEQQQEGQQRPEDEAVLEDDEPLLPLEESEAAAGAAGLPVADMPASLEPQQAKPKEVQQDKGAGNTAAEQRADAGLPRAATPVTEASAPSAAAPAPAVALQRPTAAALPTQDQSPESLECNPLENREAANLVSAAASPLSHVEPSPKPAHNAAASPRAASIPETAQSPTKVAAWQGNGPSSAAEGETAPAPAVALPEVQPTAAPSNAAPAVNAATAAVASNASAPASSQEHAASAASKQPSAAGQAAATTSVNLAAPATQPQQRQVRPMRLRSGTGSPADAAGAQLRVPLSPTTSTGSAPAKSPRTSLGGAGGSPHSSTGASPRQPGSTSGRLQQQRSFNAAQGTSGEGAGRGAAQQGFGVSSTGPAVRHTATGTQQLQRDDKGSKHLDEWAEW